MKETKFAVTKLDVKDMIITEANVQFDDTELTRYINDITEIIRKQEFSEETIAENKKYIANTRKVITAVADKRKELVKLASGNIEVVAETMKDCEKQLKDAVSTLDAEIKRHEHSLKKKKQEAIKELFDSKNSYEFLVYFDVFEPKWLNKTMSMKAIEKEIDAFLERTASDLRVIESMDNPLEVIVQYWLHKDLSKAVEEADALRKIKKQQEQQQVEEPEPTFEFVALDEEEVKLPNTYELNEEARELEEMIASLDKEIARLIAIRDEKQVQLKSVVSTIHEQLGVEEF